MSNLLTPSEHGEQSAFFQRVALQQKISPDFILPNLLFAVPNGAHLAHGGRGMSKLKAEGVRNGVADIIYLEPRGPWHFLCIEMKRSDRRNSPNGGLEPEQVEFMNAVRKVGGLFSVCYSADEAFGVLEDYLRFE